ncbi:hypothetical protein O4H26_01530 [Aequorivita viscosa]|nr:hypothetical protein [Aequorivita viscosa]
MISSEIDFETVYEFSPSKLQLVNEALKMQIAVDIIHKKKLKN